MKINKIWINTFEDAWKGYEDVAVLREFFEAGEASETELKEAYQKS